jgi:hypothetical protein
MSHFLSRILLYSELRASKELEKLYLPIFNAINLRFSGNPSKKSAKIFRIICFILDIFFLRKFKGTLSELIFGIERENSSIGLFILYRILKEWNLFQDYIQSEWIKNKIPRILNYIEASYAFLYVAGAYRFPSIEYNFTLSQLSFRKLLFSQLQTNRLIPYVLYLLLTPSSEMIINWFVENAIPVPQIKPDDNEWSNVKVKTFKMPFLKSAVQKGKCPKCGEVALDPVACQNDFLVYCKKCLGNGKEVIQVHI